MPQTALAIYGFLSNIAGVVIWTHPVTGVPLTLGKLVTLGGLAASGAQLIRSMQKRGQDPEIPKYTIRGEVVNARWVVGRARTPGVLAYWGSQEHEARMGLILSEGACERIEDVMWVDGERVELTRYPGVGGGGDWLKPKAGNKYHAYLDVYEYFKADGSQGTHLRTIPSSGASDTRIIHQVDVSSAGVNAPSGGNDGDVAVAYVPGTDTNVQVSPGNWWKKFGQDWVHQGNLTPQGGNVHFLSSLPNLPTPTVNDGDVVVITAGSGPRGKGFYWRAGFLSNQWYWEPGFNLFNPSVSAGDEDPFTPWMQAHKLKGVSWVYVRLLQGKGSDGQRVWTHTPNLEFLVKGIKIKWPGQTTPKWTENAAAIRYWWETERRGRPSTAIHRGDFDAAYSLCEQEVDATKVETIDEATGETTVTTVPLPKGYKDFDPKSKRYSINGVVTAGDDVDQVETQMDAAWAGEVIEVGGRLRFRPGVDRVVTMELTDDDTTDPRKIDDDDIIEPPAIKPWPALQERINAVSAEMAQSKVHEWTKLSLPEYVDAYDEDGNPAGALARDGVKRSGDIRLAYVVDPIAAGRLQAVNLRRARESLRLELVVKPGPNFERLGLIPTDRVKVTNSEYGLTSTRMEVERVRVRDDWSLELTLKEDHDDTYDDTLVLPALPPREIDLPDVTAVPAVAGLAVDEIAEIAANGDTIVYLVVTWTASATRETEVEVREKQPEDNPNQESTPPNPHRFNWTSGSSTGANFRYPNVASGSTYQVRARHVNRHGVAGEWSEIVERQVGGDLIPPAAPTGLDVDSLPTGFRATWTNPADPDFAAACVYVAETNVLAENAAPVATVDADYYEATGLTVGTALYVWVKAKDQSSNVGKAAGPVEVTPTPAAADTARIHLDPRDPEDVNDPNDLTLENVVDGNIYIDGDGFIWNRTGGKWIKSPVDIAGTPGAKFYTVSSWPPPNDLDPPPKVGDIAIVRGEIDENENRGVWGEYVADADSDQAGDQPGWEKRGDLTGDRGQDGPGVEFIFQRTTEDVAPDEPERDDPPTEEQKQDEWVPTGWTDDPRGADEDHPYEWVSRRKRATGEDWSEFSAPKHWAVYIPGKDGPGVEFVFRRTTGEERAPTTPTLPADKQQLDDQVPADWTDDPQGVDKTNPYEWVSRRKRNSEGEWSDFSEPKLWASYIPGQDGPGVEFIFQRTTEDNAPDRPERDDPPTEEQKQDEWVPTGWTDDPRGADDTNPYEWVSRRKRATGEDWSEFSTPKHWAVYIPGKDGPGVEFIFRRTADENAPSNIPNLTKEQRQTDEYRPSGWSDNPVGVSESYPYEWVSRRKRATGELWSHFSAPKLWASYIPGEKGAPGDQGEIGPRGEPGDPGIQGPQGDQGPIGPTGEAGDPGIKGPQGDQGPIGPTGDPGDPGLQGPQGDQGEIGPAGDPGDPGLQGTRGDQGPMGPAGAKGDPGLKGSQGEQGPTGPPGGKGSVGPKGVTGLQGPAGIPGPAGDQVFIYYTNAPADTDPATLVPVTRLANGNWTTASGYTWYADATQVPD